MSDIDISTDAANAPAEVRELARRLQQVHDTPVKLTSETSGYHIYLPCPDCLLTHGNSEVNDPKYAINASKYLGIGVWRTGVPSMLAGTDLMDALFGDDKRNNKSGVCMRTRQSKSPHFFSVSELLQMKSVTQRHPDIRTAGKLIDAAGSMDREKYWKPDETTGILCPPPPGQVVTINELPTHHPAAAYLLNRGFQLDNLYKQFRCGFCTQEYPHGTDGIYYRSMVGGWSDTSQHRVIFYSLIDNVPITWQARYPEMESEDKLSKYMLHPYATQALNENDITVECDGRQYCWSNTHVRPNPMAAWVPVYPFNEISVDGALKFLPSKYRTAKYSSREMMGWDAALHRADRDPENIKWVVLCEGPLDAARVGPGGVALIGSSISPVNAAKVASKFHLVFTAFDTDVAGRNATSKVAQMILNSGSRMPLVQDVIPIPIDMGKDIGGMPQHTFDGLFMKTRMRALRDM